jgi:hypothetical protein
MKEGKTNDCWEDKAKWCAAGIWWKARNVNRDMIGQRKGINRAREVF